MSQCKNLDDFYDIVFVVEDSQVRANSLVLMQRCPYFNTMLSAKFAFKESLLKYEGQIRVHGVGKIYFNSIIQYIYSDHFYITK
jgi:hypothetical protein